MRLRDVWRRARFWVGEWKDRGRRRRALERSPHCSAVPFEWLRQPDPEALEDVCLLVTVAPDGGVAPAVVHHARAWANAGFATIVLIVCDGSVRAESLRALEFAAGIARRANIGYDFGAWAAGIDRLGPGATRGCLVLANDSVYGPFGDFDAVIGRMRANPADVVGLTESRERGRHLQSYCLMFKPRALASPAFARFWGSIRSGERAAVIDRYELRMTSILERAGLRCAAVFRIGRRKNPTLTAWRELIDAGFPYIKAQLLRDNPRGTDLDGWERVLAAKGYDPGLIRPRA